METFDFSYDRTLASIISYLQLFDWIIGSHRGVIGTPRGRAYQDGKLLEQGASSQSIHSILWLLTGEGDRDRSKYFIFGLNQKIFFF